MAYEISRVKPRFQHWAVGALLAFVLTLTALWSTDRRQIGWRPGATDYFPTQRPW